MMWKETLGIWGWSLKNVFLLFLIQPRVLEVNENRCVVKIPLNWRTNNHLGSMYVGTLCIGADVAGGLISFYLTKKARTPVSFVFKDLHADFLKRAEGDVYFVNDDGPVIQDLVKRTIETGERQEALVHVTALVPTKLGDEPCAKFALTLSLKRR